SAFPNPVTYRWTPTTYLDPPDGIDNTVTVVTPPVGNHTYTVHSSIDDCELGSASITVVVYPLPDCSIDGSDGPVCPSTSYTYSAPVGMSTYSWSITGNASISSSPNGRIITVTTGAECNSSFT